MQSSSLLPVFVTGKSCLDTEEALAGISVTFTFAFFNVCTGSTGIEGKQVANDGFFTPHIVGGTVAELRSEREEQKRKLNIQQNISQKMNKKNKCMCLKGHDRHDFWHYKFSFCTSKVANFGSQK